MRCVPCFVAPIYGLRSRVLIYFDFFAPVRRRGERDEGKGRLRCSEGRVGLWERIYRGKVGVG